MTGPQPVQGVVANWLKGVVAGVLPDLKAVWTSRPVISTTRIGHQWKLFFMNVPNLELKPEGGASGAVETRS